MSSNYLERYAWPPLFKSYSLSKKPDIIIVIPCYKETGLANTLQCLDNCITNDLSIVVIVIVNEPENAPKNISSINQQTIEMLDQHTLSSFDLIKAYIKLPAKKAGVGLARKIGMDEAARFYHAANENGLITCFDADSTCDQNFFMEVLSYHRSTNNDLGLLYFEHPTDGENANEIINYELFLRYYTDSLRFCGFPYAYQTLGSCISVTCSAYEKYGGMSPKQAGEDFYFINKIAMHGKTGEINATRIIPSDRVSDRVPFGTGHALGKMKDSDQGYYIYNPEIFSIVKTFLDCINDEKENKSFPKLIRPFLDQISFDEHLARLRRETKNSAQLKSRFYQWFDAFKILKLTHYLDAVHERVSVEKAIHWLDDNYYHIGLKNMDLLTKLEAIRKHNRNHSLN